MREHVQPGRRRGAHLLLQRLLHGPAAAAGAEPGHGPAVPGGGPELRVLLRGHPPHDGRRPALLQGPHPPLQARPRPPALHAPRRAPRRRPRGIHAQGVQPVEGDARPPQVALRRRRRQCRRQEERQGRRRRLRHGHRRHGRVQAGPPAGAMRCDRRMDVDCTHDMIENLLLLLPRHHRPVLFLRCAVLVNDQWLVSLDRVRFSDRLSAARWRHCPCSSVYVC